MSRRLLAVLLLGALVAAPAASSAQISTSISIAGGLALPVSDLNTAGAKTGYNVAAGLNLGVPVLPFGVRLEAGYNGFQNKLSGLGSLNIISGTANAVMGLAPGPISPYVIGGLGFYQVSCSGCTSASAAGLNAGGGIRFGLGGLSTFAEIRYHAMLGDKAKGANLQYVPVTFGISF